jgi:hypothetical protein
MDRLGKGDEREDSGWLEEHLLRMFAEWKARARETEDLEAGGSGDDEAA